MPMMRKPGMSMDEMTDVIGTALPHRRGHYEDVLASPEMSPDANRNTRGGSKW